MWWAAYLRVLEVDDGAVVHDEVDLLDVSDLAHTHLLQVLLKLRVLSRRGLAHGLVRTANTSNTGDLCLCGGGGVCSEGGLCPINDKH